MLAGVHLDAPKGFAGCVCFLVYVIKPFTDFMDNVHHKSTG